MYDSNFFPSFLRFHFVWDRNGTIMDWYEQINASVFVSNYAGPWFLPLYALLHETDQVAFSKCMTIGAPFTHSHKFLVPIDVNMACHML